MWESEKEGEREMICSPEKNKKSLSGEIQQNVGLRWWRGHVREICDSTRMISVEALVD